MLRFDADFNSGGGSKDSFPCSGLLFKDGDSVKDINAVADKLPLFDGMKVILHYEDPAEEFEVGAILKNEKGPDIYNGSRWVAWPDWSTYRVIRG